VRNPTKNLGFWRALFGISFSLALILGCEVQRQRGKASRLQSELLQAQHILVARQEANRTSAAIAESLPKPLLYEGDRLKIYLNMEAQPWCGGAEFVVYRYARSARDMEALKALRSIDSIGHLPFDAPEKSEYYQRARNGDWYITQAGRRFMTAYMYEICLLPRNPKYGASITLAQIRSRLDE